MSQRPGPIYEVTLNADREVVDECDRWLDEHVRTSLRDANVSECRLFPVSSPNPGHAGRVCQHLMPDDTALDEFLDSAPGNIEANIARAFGDKVQVETRVLREDDSHDIPPTEIAACLNCGTRLRGQYCGHCGQRSRSRLIKLWQLLSEAFGDLFELDSRLWKTLIPLVIRPGRLTHDYLQGRRARFMPPFRMYLVLSLVFFVVAFFDPRDELSLLFAPPENVETAELVEPDVGSGVIIGSDDDEDAAEACESMDLEMNEFLARRLTPKRLQQVCQKIIADQGKSLLEKVLNNVPTALIVLLPLMALVLKALYPLSRRYYVEHLLFFVHLHSFFFLLFTLQILFTRLAESLHFPDALATLVVIAGTVYVPVYVFVALRRVYGQNRFFTFLKFIALTIAYILGFSTIMALTFAIAVFSI